MGCSREQRHQGVGFYGHCCFNLHPVTATVSLSGVAAEGTLVGTVSQLLCGTFVPRTPDALQRPVLSPRHRGEFFQLEKPRHGAEKCRGGLELGSLVSQSSTLPIGLHCHYPCYNAHVLQQ